MATASTSHSVTFSWDPPPPDEQNGIITEYFINITVANSGDIFQESTAEHSLSINTFQPFTTYLCVIAASTSAGTGPYSMVLTLTTPQDGMLLIALSHGHAFPNFNDNIICFAHVMLKPGSACGQRYSLISTERASINQ